MNNCIFCKIRDREVPSHIIYEDDKVMAFLDAFPISLGHTLIIPKQHFSNIYDIEERDLVEIIKVARKIAKAYEEIFGINNLQLINNAGKGGQQEVFHFYLHLIPRYENDGIDLSHPKANITEEEKINFLNKFKNSGIV